MAQIRPGPEKYGPNSTHRDEFGLHFSLAWPSPAWPGPYIRPFLRLACHGPGQFILAQIRPGPEKYGPNSTYRDEFGLHFSLARPSLAWPGPYRRSFLRLARHGPGRSFLAQVWPGPEKNGPNSSLVESGRNSISALLETLLLSMVKRLTLN